MAGRSSPSPYTPHWPCRSCEDLICTPEEGYDRLRGFAPLKAAQFPEGSLLCGILHYALGTHAWVRRAEPWKMPVAAMVENRPPRRELIDYWNSNGLYENT
jgi:hypothetical protein